MNDSFYNVQEIANQYSQYGEVEYNPNAGVMRLKPFVEQRTEIMVDPSVPEDMEVEDIPPHLKTTLELYFVNAEALHANKHMIRCVAPGQLQTFLGKVWKDIPYREEWRSWEDYVAEMEKIDYPFIVLPNDHFIPRSFMLVQSDKMEKFKSILREPNRQVSLEEFESKWVFLFHPDALGNPDFPIDSWRHVAESPSAYVDVVTPNGDGTVNIEFTVPPLLSLNQGRSSIVSDDLPIAMDSFIKRCNSESSVIPKSGDDRFIETMEQLRATPQELNKHYAMWKKIYERYGWKITGDEDSVNTETVEIKQDGNEEDDPFEMASVRF